MVAGLVPIKTPQGQAELTTRQRSVSQRHRTVLFLIDGKRTAAEVRDMAAKAGVPEGCFGELIELGMVLLIEPTFSQSVDGSATPGPLHVDLPLPGPDSMLPASRSLFPESATGDSTLGAVSSAQAWLNADSAGFDTSEDDPVFLQARLLMVRAVLDKAPIAGALTLLKLRRARNRADLAELLDEVEGRISRPHRSLAAMHTMRRVRQMLGGRADSALETA